jgi:hypothetical protein
MLSFMRALEITNGQDHRSREYAQVGRCRQSVSSEVCTYGDSEVPVSSNHNVIDRSSMPQTSMARTGIDVDRNSGIFPARDDDTRIEILTFGCFQELEVCDGLVSLVMNVGAVVGDRFSQVDVARLMTGCDAKLWRPRQMSR